MKNISATREALGGRAALVCGVRRRGGSQSEFSDRYEACDGAMEWFAGGVQNDPGFRVPNLR